MVQARKLTDVERSQGFTQVVFVRPGSPRLGSGSIEVVNPKTGESVGQINRIEFSRRQRGSRKFKGELFVFLPARQEIEQQIRRKEEKKETKELAEKEAAFEAQRIKRGKIKEKDVILTQPGAAKLLSARLETEKKAVKLRETETFVRTKGPGLERGEFLPRKELIGRVTLEEPEPVREVEEAEPRETIIKTETVFKPGDAFSVGLAPISEQLTQRKLEGEGVGIQTAPFLREGKVPQQLTQLEQLSVGIKEVPFALKQTIREPKRALKGFASIPITLGKDIINIVKGPQGLRSPPGTPKFVLEVAKDAELRKSAIRIGGTAGVVGGLTLLSGAATVGLGVAATGLEGFRFLQRPSPEQFGRTAFVGGVSALAIGSAVKGRVTTVPTKGGKLTLIRAPVKEPILFEFGKRGVIIARGIAKPTPSTLPSVRAFDLGSIVTGRGTEILSAKVGIGSAASSRLLIAKPEVITGVKTPRFVSAIKTFPSLLRGLVKKGSRKVKLKFEFVDDIKRTGGPPLKFEVKEIVGRDVFRRRQIIDGKSTLTERTIEEVRPTTLGRVIGEQFAGIKDFPTITSTGRIRLRDRVKGPGVSLEIRDVSRLGQKFKVQELGPKKTVGQLFREEFSLIGAGLRQPPVTVEKRGSLIGLTREAFRLPTRKDFGLSIKQISTRPQRILTPGITKTGSFRDLFRPSGGKGISLEIRDVSRLGQKFKVQELGPKKTVGQLLSEVLIPKGRPITFQAKGISIPQPKSERFAQFKLIRTFQLEQPLASFAPQGVRFTKQAGRREAVRFLTQPEAPRQVALRIPKLRLDFAKRIVGLGIGVGEVSVRRINLGLIDIRLAKFGPQRVIGFEAKEPQALLELFVKERRIASPEGRVLGTRATAFPSGREVILPGKARLFTEEPIFRGRVPFDTAEPKTQFTRIGSRSGRQELQQITEQISEVKQESISQAPQLQASNTFNIRGTILLPQRRQDRFRIAGFESGVLPISSEILGTKSQQKQKVRPRRIQQVITEQVSFLDEDTLKDRGIIFGSRRISESLLRRDPELIQETELITDTPPPPRPPFFFLPPPLLFPTEKRKRGREPLSQAFAFTPDFIAAVANEFGPAPTQTRFTGQERRFRVRGRRFVSPLPKKGPGILQMIARQVGG